MESLQLLLLLLLLFAVEDVIPEEEFTLLLELSCCLANRGLVSVAASSSLAARRELTG